MTPNLTPDQARGNLGRTRDSPVRLGQLGQFVPGTLRPLLRAGIAAVIAGHKDMALVGEANDGDEAIETFRLHRPDVTLMDLQMPEKSGIEAMIAILREFPDARIVVLTTFKGDVQAVCAIKAGASGFLLKNMLRNELVETIRTVHAGGRRIPPRVAAEVAEHITSRAERARRRRPG